MPSYTLPEALDQLRDEIREGKVKPVKALIYYGSARHAMPGLIENY